MKISDTIENFIRELFEMGIPVTYGSDSHNVYENVHLEVEKYLKDVGFCSGDFSEIKDDNIDLDFLKDIAEKDCIFPDIDYKIYM